MTHSFIADAGQEDQVVGAGEEGGAVDGAGLSAQPRLVAAAWWPPGAARCDYQTRHAAFSSLARMRPPSS